MYIYKICHVLMLYVKLCQTGHIRHVGQFSVFDTCPEALLWPGFALLFCFISRARYAIRTPLQMCCIHKCSKGWLEKSNKRFMSLIDRLTFDYEVPLLISLKLIKIQIP